MARQMQFSFVYIVCLILAVSGCSSEEDASTEPALQATESAAGSQSPSQDRASDQKTTANDGNGSKLSATRIPALPSVPERLDLVSKISQLQPRDSFSYLISSSDDALDGKFLKLVFKANQGDTLLFELDIEGEAAEELPISADKTTWLLPKEATAGRFGLTNVGDEYPEEVLPTQQHTVKNVSYTYDVTGARQAHGYVRITVGPVATVVPAGGFVAAKIQDIKASDDKMLREIWISPDLPVATRCRWRRSDSTEILLFELVSFTFNGKKVDQPDSWFSGSDRSKTIQWMQEHTKWGKQSQAIDDFISQLHEGVGSHPGKTLQWILGSGTTHDEKAYQLRWTNGKFTAQEAPSALHPETPTTIGFSAIESPDSQTNAAADQPPNEETKKEKEQKLQMTLVTRLGEEIQGNFDASNTDTDSMIGDERKWYLGFACRFSEQRRQWATLLYAGDGIYYSIPWHHIETIIADDDGHIVNCVDGKRYVGKLRSTVGPNYNQMYKLANLKRVIVQHVAAPNWFYDDLKRIEINALPCTVKIGDKTLPNVRFESFWGSDLEYHPPPEHYYLSVKKKTGGRFQIRIDGQDEAMEFDMSTCDVWSTRRVKDWRWSLAIKRTGRADISGMLGSFGDESEWAVSFWLDNGIGMLVCQPTKPFTIMLSEEAAADSDVHAADDEPAANADSTRKMRTWTDITGRHKTVAALHGIDADGSARLQKSDGTVVAVPANKLSASDLKYARETLEKTVGDGELPIDE